MIYLFKKVSDGKNIYLCFYDPPSFLSVSHDLLYYFFALYLASLSCLHWVPSLTLRCVQIFLRDATLRNGMWNGTVEWNWELANGKREWNKTAATAAAAAKTFITVWAAVGFVALWPLAHGVGQGRDGRCRLANMCRHGHKKGHENLFIMCVRFTFSHFFSVFYIDRLTPLHPFQSL